MWQCWMPIEDCELANIVRSREDEDAIDINWENL